MMPPMLEQRIHQHFIDSADLKYRAAEALSPLIAQAIRAITGSLTNGGKVLACGNGGSASDAMHFAGELLGRLEQERPELACVALCSDSSVMTALANDYGYDHVFAKQVRGLGVSGDVLVAITSSGNSPSILKAVQAAHERDMTVIALSGKGGGKLSPMLRTPANGMANGPDIDIVVPHDRTIRVQELHILAIHAICDGVDASLLGAVEEAQAALQPE
jgi:D-sedoheptulose 7-phosphate isomerase